LDFGEIEEKLEVYDWMKVVIRFGRLKMRMEN